MSASASDRSEPDVRFLIEEEKKWKNLLPIGEQEDKELADLYQMAREVKQVVDKSDSPSSFVEVLKETREIISLIQEISLCDSKSNALPTLKEKYIKKLDEYAKLRSQVKPTSGEIADKMMYFLGAAVIGVGLGIAFGPVVGGAVAGFLALLGIFYPMNSKKLAKKMEGFKIVGEAWIKKNHPDPLAHLRSEMNPVGVGDESINSTPRSESKSSSSQPSDSTSKPSQKRQ